MLLRGAVPPIGALFGRAQTAQPGARIAVRRTAADNVARSASLPNVGHPRRGVACPACSKNSAPTPQATSGADCRPPPRFRVGASSSNDR